MQNSKPSCLVSMKNWCGSNIFFVNKEGLHKNLQKVIFSPPLNTQGVKRRAKTTLGGWEGVRGRYPTCLTYSWPSLSTISNYYKEKVHVAWSGVSVFHLLHNSPFSSVLSQEALPWCSSGPNIACLLSPFPSWLLSQKELRRTWELAYIVTLPC